MIIFIEALVPIIALIALGYILKKTKFLPNEVWLGLEKLTYFIFFPALLVHTIGTKSFAGIPIWDMFVVICLTINIIAVIFIILRRKITEDNATFTSIFQGGVRFNSYISLAIAYGLYGDNGLLLSSVSVGFIIVIANLWCVLVFVMWGENSIKGVVPIIKAVFYNPLIISCFLGLFLSASNIEVNHVVVHILKTIGSLTLPIGLLTIGAALKIRQSKQYIEPIFYASFMQFVIKPVLASILVTWIGLSGVQAAVIIIAFIVPTASSSYILAKQLGGNAKVMATIVTTQTMIAFMAMPILAELLL